MTQSHRRSGRPVVKDNVVLNARRASGKPKSNATSFKKGRKKTGGRAAGTPNKTARGFWELMWAGAEAAGNELGGDGCLSFLKGEALNHPTSYLSQLVRLVPQQLEPGQTSPSEDDKVLTSMEEVREELRRYGVRPEEFGGTYIPLDTESIFMLIMRISSLRITGINVSNNPRRRRRTLSMASRL
jgi:hypothetical protein